MANAQIVAHEMYVPDKILDNQYFVQLGKVMNGYNVYSGMEEDGSPIFENEKVTLTEEKILSNTGGMRERRQISGTETNIDLVVRAFERSNFPSKDLAGIIIATISDEVRFPSVACRVQKRIEAKNVKFTEDIGSACSGFTHALDHAALRVSKGEGPHLVVGLETLTKITDYTEINCDLFGDGCGLVVLDKTEDNERGIIATEFASDVSGINFIYKDKLGYLRMPAGPRVKGMAWRGMVKIAHNLIEKTPQICKDEVKIYCPHQANGRIIDEYTKALSPEDAKRIYRNVEKYGNMSSATIAVATSEILKQKLVSSGEILVLTDIGSGLSLGGALIRI